MFCGNSSFPAYHPLAAASALEPAARVGMAAPTTAAGWQSEQAAFSAMTAARLPASLPLRHRPRLPLWAAADLHPPPLLHLPPWLPRLLLWPHPPGAAEVWHPRLPRPLQPRLLWRPLSLVGAVNGNSISLHTTAWRNFFDDLLFGYSVLFGSPGSSTTPNSTNHGYLAEINTIVSLCNGAFVRGRRLRCCTPGWSS